MSLDQLIELAERFRRPSNIARLAACPAAAIVSALVLELDGEAPAAPEANLGNEVHAGVQEGVGYALTVTGGDWTAAANMACDKAAARGMDGWSVSCIRMTLDFYHQLIVKYQIEPENILAEHALDMAATGFRRKGTSDLVLVVPFKLVVIVDLKAGFVDQGDAEDHDQMATYSAAAAETFKVKKVVTYLWQPRAERERRATCATFDAAALHDTTTWALAVLWRSRRPDAQLCPGFSQCSTCPALRRCPAAKDFIVNAQEAIALIGAPTTAESWGEALGAAKLAEKWAEAWKNAGKAHLVAGGEATGFKLGTPRSIRSVVGVPEAMAKLRDAGHEDEALAALSMAVAKLSEQAQQIIAGNITENLTDPPLVATKAKKAVA